MNTPTTLFPVRVRIANLEPIQRASDIERMVKFTAKAWFLLLAVCFLASCRQGMIVSMSQEIVLTREQPVHPRFSLRLLSIAPDGRATVEFTQSRTIYEAMPGENFHRNGGSGQDVRLVSASPDKGEVRIQVHYCVDR